MPQVCYISTCDSISIGLCSCCNQYLCRDHFIEHDYLLRTKLNDLTEKINEIDAQFNRFDIEKIKNDWIDKLNQWKYDSYEIIDRFYVKKYEEFNNFIQQILNKQEEDIMKLKLNIAKMINLQQITKNKLNLLTSDIQILENQIKYMSIQFHINSLIIKDNLINISILNSYQSELSSPYQIIDRVALSSGPICSSNQSLLFHQNSRLYLLDENLSIIDEKPWSNSCIRDICWSKILNSFFLITSDDVYLVEQEPFSIERIQTIQGGSWQSCTCSNTRLYLSKDTWNSSIEEFSLTPSIRFLQHRERLERRNQKQRIDSIEYSNETLALVINDQTKQEIFIELRSLTTFNRLWLCGFSIEYTERKLHCCLTNLNAWMVADWGSSSIFHITENGNIKETIKYKHQIHYMHSFETNTLIISTNDSINFHRL